MFAIAIATVQTVVAAPVVVVVVVGVALLVAAVAAVMVAGSTGRRVRGQHSMAARVEATCVALVCECFAAANEF